MCVAPAGKQMKGSDVMSKNNEKKTSGFTHETTVGKTVEWYTPPSIFEALDIVFDLDAASPGFNNCFTPAKNCVVYDDGSGTVDYLGTVSDKGDTFFGDALDMDWWGNVWCNPPYDRNMMAWVQKMADHGKGIMLVFARTDAKWAQAALESCDAVCFIAGRVKFIDSTTGEPGGTPGSGSMFAQALRDSGLGLVMSK